ncbi:hypothetical protein PFISCL1PPCAC_4501, partial [Pristionchus fissidentatus]
SLDSMVATFTIAKPQKNSVDVVQTIQPKSPRQFRFVTAIIVFVLLFLIGLAGTVYCYPHFTATSPITVITLPKPPFAVFSIVFDGQPSQSGAINVLVEGFIFCKYVDKLTVVSYTVAIFNENGVIGGGKYLPVYHPEFLGRYLNDEWPTYTTNGDLITSIEIRTNVTLNGNEPVLADESCIFSIRDWSADPHISLRFEISIIVRTGMNKSGEEILGQINYTETHDLRCYSSRKM